MKVFMSWSGARSKAAAELLHNWIKCVIQASKPWISTRGIGRGSVWFTEINNELKDTSVGIICLTHQNKASPWILFEAGALAKGLATNRVCTFLVDLGPNDVEDPLAQFNHTEATKEGLWGLVLTLNASLENMLDGPTLTAVFDQFWPDFEAKFKAILETHPQEAKVEARTESNILEEILQTTRGLDKRLRSVESAPSYNYPFAYDDLSPTSPRVQGDAAHLLFKTMAGQGLPHDALMIRARELGIPPSVVAKLLKSSERRTAAEVFGATKDSPPS
ncbi:MAG: hypothetical protein JWM47_4440 [Acidimicrobiales bacterium]|nr:hypothetical protein [Acidimicrobiales bacterium]